MILNVSIPNSSASNTFSSFTLLPKNRISASLEGTPELPVPTAGQEKLPVGFLLAEGTAWGHSLDIHRVKVGKDLQHPPVQAVPHPGGSLDTKPPWAPFPWRNSCCYPA